VVSKETGASSEDAVTAFYQSDQRYRQALTEARAILFHLRLSGGKDNYVIPAPFANKASQTYLKF
jgi:hypothetical protein